MALNLTFQREIALGPIRNPRIMQEHDAQIWVYGFDPEGNQVNYFATVVSIANDEIIFAPHPEPFIIPQGLQNPEHYNVKKIPRYPGCAFYQMPDSDAAFVLPVHPRLNEPRPR